MPPGFAGVFESAADRTKNIMRNICRAGIFRLFALSLFISLAPTAVGQAAAPDWREIGKFALGAGSILPVHEAGHAVSCMAIDAEITDVGFKHVNCKLSENGSFTQLQILSISGYLAQNIAAETILRSRSLHDDSFALGMFAAAHYINLSNAVRFFRKGDDADNDVSAFSAHGGNGGLLAAVLLAYTTYSLYRMDKDTDMAGYFKRNLFRVSYNF